MAVSIVKAKEQLMNIIDVADLLEFKKVERYIDPVKVFKTISKTINKEDESVTIKKSFSSSCQSPSSYK